MTPSPEVAARRAEFLAKPRLGALLTNRKEGTPMGVPVWFEWDGEVVRMFGANDTTKIKRLRRDARASLLVSNNLDEPEFWVSFDGRVEIHPEGGIELAERLAPRYWDLNDPGRRETFELWKSAKEAMCLLTLHPTKIRSGEG